MKCAYCGRTDSPESDTPKQCMCYTWFVYTCTVCFVTLLIGLACCVYCTCLLVSINKTIMTREDQAKGDVALQKNTFQEENGVQESIVQVSSY